MDIFNFLNVLGGLALFLYGMSVMASKRGIKEKGHRRYIALSASDLPANLAIQVSTQVLDNMDTKENHCLFA